MDAETARLLQTLVLIASQTFGVAALWRRLTEVSRKLDTKADAAQLADIGERFAKVEKEHASCENCSPLTTY